MLPHAKFVQQHFEWLAKWLSSIKPDNIRNELACDMARSLELTNKKFDMDLFLTKACVTHTTHPIELKSYKKKSGEVVVLVRDKDYYTVECFDSSDMSRWCKMFRTASEASDEYERWRD